MKKKITIILLVFIFLLNSGIGCKNSMDNETAKKMRKITLNYWRVWDGPDDFAGIIEQYNRLHPNITIKYKKLRYAEYEQELIEAFATDRGPDIFSLHNTWISGYKARGLLLPLPGKITMVFPELAGSIKKEIVYNKKTSKTITLNELKNNFVDSVYNDVVITTNDSNNRPQHRIYGLPLYIDSLAMYYNKDLFNNAGITSPPEYWNTKFQQDVKKLTKQNNRGEIIQAGVAMGGSENIERSTDILSVLMMQNGTEMARGNKINFHQRPSSHEGRSYHPGIDALRFYTDFASPAKEVYSWNNQLDNSLDLFVSNKLAIMFGYTYMLPEIKSRAPRLNFAVAKLPQIEGNLQSINFANYWAEVVSKKTKYPEEAWDFIQFATTREKIVKTFLDKTNKPTALRALIDKQIEEGNIGAFIEQILTAKSWYRGRDAETAENAMREMIDKANAGHQTLTEIINLGAQKIQQTL